LTIPEAIEILQNELNHGFRCGYEDLNDAQKLGIEAMKFTKGLRDTGAMPIYALLPGETEEQEEGK